MDAHQKSEAKNLFASCSPGVDGIKAKRGSHRAVLTPAKTNVQSNVEHGRAQKRRSEKHSGNESERRRRRSSRESDAVNVRAAKGTHSLVAGAAYSPHLSFSPGYV